MANSARPGSFSSQDDIISFSLSSFEVSWQNPRVSEQKTRILHPISFIKLGFEYWLGDSLGSIIQTSLYGKFDGGVLPASARAFLSNFLFACFWAFSETTLPSNTKLCSVISL